MAIDDASQSIHLSFVAQSRPNPIGGICSDRSFQGLGAGHFSAGQSSVAMVILFSAPPVCFSRQPHVPLLAFFAWKRSHARQISTNKPGPPEKNTEKSLRS